MTGTASPGKGVRREAESEGSRKQNSDLTNRNWIQGSHGGVTRPWTGRPGSHSDIRVSRSGEGRVTVTWLTLGGLRVCPGEPDYLAGNSGDGHGGVSRGRSTDEPRQVGGQRREGPNLVWQGAGEKTRWTWSDSKACGINRACWNGGRTRCATRRAATAEPKLLQARSHKRSRRWTDSEP